MILVHNYLFDVFYFSKLFFWDFTPVEGNVVDKLKQELNNSKQTAEKEINGI